MTTPRKKYPHPRGLSDLFPCGHSRSRENTTTTGKCRECKNEKMRAYHANERSPKSLRLEGIPQFAPPPRVPEPSAAGRSYGLAPRRTA